MLKITTVNKLLIFIILFSLMINLYLVSIDRAQAMENSNKLQITKVCSNNIQDRNYMFEIVNDKLSYWKNGKSVMVYDNTIESDDKNVVNYEHQIKSGHPFPWLVNNEEVGENIFTKKGLVDYSNNVEILYIRDSSYYMEGIEFFLIKIAKDHWIGHIVVWEYQETGSLETLGISETIKFNKC